MLQPSPHWVNTFSLPNSFLQISQNMAFFTALPQLLCNVILCFQTSDMSTLWWMKGFIQIMKSRAEACLWNFKAQSNFLEIHVKMSAFWNGTMLKSKRSLTYLSDSKLRFCFFHCTLQSSSSLKHSGSAGLQKPFTFLAPASLQYKVPRGSCRIIGS